MSREVVKEVAILGYVNVGQNGHMHLEGLVDFSYESVRKSYIKIFKVFLI